MEMCEIIWNRKIKKIYLHMCLESRVRYALEARYKFKEIADFYNRGKWDIDKGEDYQFCYNFFRKYMVK
jgi:hypothetical protein